MSFRTCECGGRAKRNDKGKYICPDCGKEVKQRPVGWGVKS